MGLGETLLHSKSKDKKCCLYKMPYVAAPVRVLGDVIANFSALRATNFGCTYNNQNFFLVQEWRVSQETRLVISRFLREFFTRRSTSKSGTGKDYLSHNLRSPTKSTFKCLCKQTPLWRIVMSKSLRNPEDQDERKEEMLSDQPRLTRVTPTALLGSWVLQPIKDVRSLGTDFEMHAKWQGFVEEPAAKDFIVRKVHTIKLNKVQGTYWNVNKCKERLRNCPEAGNSLPKLYCVDLAEAYVTQESVSSRILSGKKRYCDRSMDVRMRDIWRKAKWGKKTGTNSSTRFPQASCFKKTGDMCQEYGGACTT